MKTPILNFNIVLVMILMATGCSRISVPEISPLHPANAHAEEGPPIHMRKLSAINFAKSNDFNDNNRQAEPSMRHHPGNMNTEARR